MPVTFKVADHVASTLVPGAGIPYSSREQDDILDEISKSLRILQSSVDGKKAVISYRNGLVQGVLLAYTNHHNLVIRPDDIWIAILSQLSCYIKAHAEELREKFVSHPGKEPLVVVSESATVEGMNFGDLTVQMSEKLQNHVKDESLVEWMLPAFSTTTPNDIVICSALLMSSFKEYFSYVMRTRCGIPYITLEGTQADWQSILTRVEKIEGYGSEPAQWTNMLRVVLSRFIHAFDHNGPVEDKQFWDRIIHQDSGSGVQYISGWMSAFCAWDAKGAFFAAQQDKGASHGWYKTPEWVYDLKFDGVPFPRVDSIPDGFAEVDVQVVNVATGKINDCGLLGGHVGIYVEEGERANTICLAPQWFMFVKKPKRKKAHWISSPGEPDSVVGKST